MESYVMVFIIARMCLIDSVCGNPSLTNLLKGGNNHE
jgi:hypothetical protein